MDTPSTLSPRISRALKSARAATKTTQRLLIEMTIKTLRNLGARSVKTDDNTFVQLANLCLHADGSIEDMTQVPSKILDETGSTEFILIFQERGALTPINPNLIVDSDGRDCR